MTLRRTSLLPILPVLWAIAAGYYWRTSVLLLPERVFDLPKGTAFRGFAPNGDAVLVHTVRPGARPDGHTDVGPMERWRFPELKKVREIFTADDAIDMAHPDEQGRLVIIHDRAAWLANFETGELLELLPGVETQPSYRVLHNDRLVWCRNQTVVIYDLTTKRILQSHAGQQSFGNVTDALCVLNATSQIERRGWVRYQNTLVNMRTGGLDGRFDQQGRVQHIELSSDGNVAVIYTADELVICDASSGKKQWSIPRPPVDYDDVRFEQNSTVLALDVLDRQKMSRTARWHVADGAVIDPVPYGSIGHVSRSFDKLGRFAIDNHFYAKGTAAHGVDRAFYETKRWFGVKNLVWPDSNQSTWEVRDLTADRPIGAYSHLFCGGVIAPDSSGFIAATDEDMNNHRLRYYRLPPARDWGWLLRWALLPAIGLLMLLVIVQIRRAPTRHKPDAPHPNPLGRLNT